MASGRRRKKTITSPPCDIISELPINIIETILVCLPLQDAVRTSILSRKWRYNWVGIPQLVFDETFYQGLKKSEQMSLKIRLVMTIYQVLLFHHGLILKFTLMVSESGSEIDQLMHFLSRKGVEDFTLDVGSLYKLPSSFFSCLQLRRLKLENCVFKPPPVFNGFSRLINLDFDGVDFDADLFGDFISRCPLLEELSLDESTDFDFLEIDAPMLRSLYTSSSFNSIRFKNTILLESITFSNGLAGYFEDLEEGCTSKMIEIFGSLPVIEHLCLGYLFVEMLSLGAVPEKLPFTLNHLKCLEFYQFSFGVREELLVVLCLIKSSPNLEEISSTLIHDEGPALELLKVQDYSDFSLNQLRKFDMFVDHESTAEKEFYKLIVANSPLLL